MNKSKMFRLAAVAAVIAGPLTGAMATNGMNMEGYGPISTGMGGASQAIDNGNAGMAQNPATLSMMQGASQLDLAVGFLGPKIKASMPGMPAADSGGTSYMMPAVGYTRRSNALTYGIGMFAQGGMGTEYGANSIMAGQGASAGAARSELGVGKVILPVSYQVNSQLAVGGSLDFMWASMDVMMNMPGATAAGLITGASGMLAGAAPALAGAQNVRIDFSDGDKYTGAAKSTGYTAKLGAVYKLNNAVTIGGSYQFKSSLGDMKTAAGSAKMSSEAMGGFADTGTMTVRNFQWPSMLAIGASWQASPTVLVAADVKSIGWAEVMKNFNMTYDSANGMGSVSFALPQNWKDQTVFNLGAAWKATNALTLRAGVNIADNPVPNAMVNPLFPATIKDHYTLGLGYQFSKSDEFNMSLVMAPSVSTTNAQGVTVTHEQTNWQFMYTHRY